MAECDECIIPGDEPWDCTCFSHNPHGDRGHSKNPSLLGIEPKEFRERYDELTEWCERCDGDKMKGAKCKYD